VHDPVTALSGVSATERRQRCEARGLTKRYGRTFAVKDLSFSVRPGRVTGFLGPKGAGKWTTMRMILGLDWPAAGDVRIARKRYRELREPVRHVGALLDAAPAPASPSRPPKSPTSEITTSQITTSQITTSQIDFVDPAGTPFVDPAGTPFVDPAGTPFVDPAGTLSPIPQGPRRSGETFARRLLRVRPRSSSEAGRRCRAPPPSSGPRGRGAGPR